MKSRLILYHRGCIGVGSWWEIRNLKKVVFLRTTPYYWFVCFLFCIDNKLKATLELPFEISRFWRKLLLYILISSIIPIPTCFPHYPLQGWCHARSTTRNAHKFSIRSLSALNILKESHYFYVMCGSFRQFFREVYYLFLMSKNL